MARLTVAPTIWLAFLFLSFGSPPPRAPSAAAAPTQEVLPPLRINDVAITGIEHVVELKPGVAQPAGLAVFERAASEDGLDEVMFVGPDSGVWLAYGSQIILYTRSADRVEFAAYGGKPVRVLYIDDENTKLDLRPRMSRGVAAGLGGIILLGVFIGLITGLLARRGPSGLRRDPLPGRLFYGLVVGVVLALLIYGMSEQRFDVNSLLSGMSDRHLEKFLRYPSHD